MDKHYNSIKNLIENNLVSIKKNEISSNNRILITYHSIGKEIVDAQQEYEKVNYGKEVIKPYALKLKKTMEGTIVIAVCEKWDSFIYFFQNCRHCWHN